MAALVVAIDRRGRSSCTRGMADDEQRRRRSLEVSGNGRYLVDQAGQPFLYTADTSWTLLSKLSVADAKRYIDIRKSQGFNTIQTNLIAWFRFDSGARGVAFEDDDLSKPNEAYWSGVDEIIDYAASQQMLLSIGIMWLSSNGGYDNSDAPTTSEMTTYATWVGERYRDRSNIIWFMGGDDQPEVLMSPTIKGGRALQAADPNHLITYHPGSNVYAIRDEGWLSFNSFQRNFNDPPFPYELVREGHDLTPVKPILDIEPPYEPDPCCGDDLFTSPQENRRCWMVGVPGGALGVVYGGRQYGSWNIGDGGNIDWNGTNRQPPRQTAHIRKVLEVLPWYMLVTDWDDRVVTGGRGEYGDADYAIRGQCHGRIARRRLHAHVQGSDGRSEPVERNGDRQMGRSGERQPAWGRSRPTPNSGTQSFRPPGTNSGGDDDWVLLLSA